MASPPGMISAAELLEQPGRAQCRLPGVLVDVEHAALGASLRPRLQLEDRSLDTVFGQDAGQGKAAETGADDGDRVMRGHGSPCGVGVATMPLIKARKPQDSRSPGSPETSRPASAATCGWVAATWCARSRAARPIRRRRRGSCRVACSAAVAVPNWSRMSTPQAACPGHAALGQQGQQGLDQVQVVLAVGPGHQGGPGQARVLEQHDRVVVSTFSSRARQSRWPRRRDRAQQLVQDRRVQLGRVAEVHVQRGRAGVQVLGQAPHGDLGQALGPHDPTAAATMPARVSAGLAGRSRRLVVLPTELSCRRLTNKFVTNKFARCRG